MTALLTGSVTPARKLPDVKDVLIAMLQTGLDGVKGMKHTPSKGTMLRAAMKLKSMGQDDKVLALHDYIKEQHPPGKHSVQPKDGEEREYKVCAIGSYVYGRPPLITLGLKPGDVYKASFRPGQVILTAKVDS